MEENSFLFDNTTNNHQSAGGRRASGFVQVGQFPGIRATVHERVSAVRAVTMPALAWWFIATANPQMPSWERMAA
jgi:hypothetical protein